MAAFSLRSSGLRSASTAAWCVSSRQVRIQPAIRCLSSTPHRKADNEHDLQVPYGNLGRSGLKVSKVILGTMSYGSSKWQDWVLDEEQALPLLEHAYKLGLNTWDTADTYSHGLSEKVLGKAIRKYNIPRNKLVIMSKCFFGVVPPEGPQSRMLQVNEVGQNDGSLVNQVGLSRKHIFDAVDASVERLGTYIDVLQIHRLDREMPREEIMRALNDVVNAGKVRYLGASSMKTYEFQALQNIADKHGYHRFISMQNYHNLIYREEEREMIPYCQETGVGLIPWSPMARGMLARPWGSRGTTREGTDWRLKGMRNRETEADQSVVSRVEELAAKHGVPMATVSIAWSIKKGDYPILGLASKERIDQAVAATRFQLSDEESKYLEEPYIPKATEGI